MGAGQRSLGNRFPSARNMSGEQIVITICPGKSDTFFATMCSMGAGGGVGHDGMFFFARFGDGMGNSPSSDLP